MIRVARINSDGSVHHAVRTEGPVEVVTAKNGRLVIIMPMRCWTLFEGQTLVIEAV